MYSQNVETYNRLVTGHYPLENTLVGVTVTIIFLCITITAAGVFLSRTNLFSRVVDWAAHRYDLTAASRKAFRKAMAAPPRVQPKPHPNSAAFRAVARGIIDDISLLLGYNQYRVQSGSGNNSIAGSHSYEFMKDVQNPTRWDAAPDKPLYVMIDTDHDRDMPEWLLSHVDPTVIYTTIPEAVAHVDAEWSFTFDANNNIVVETTGGGSYTEQLWNYRADIITVTTPNGWDFLNFWAPTCAAYQTEVKRITTHKSLVMLIPIATWYGPFGWLTAKILGRPLKRLKPVEGDFLRLDIVSDIHPNYVHYRSTGMVNSYGCATIPVMIDDTIATTALNSSIKLTLSQIHSTIEDYRMPMSVDQRVAAVVLVAYHNQKKRNKPDLVQPLCQAAYYMSYHPELGDGTPDKPGMVPFMTPMDNNAYVPTKSVGNTLETIEKRVIDVKSDAAMTPFMITCTKEFIAKCVKKGSLHPVEHQTVFEKQDRPAQQRILLVAANSHQQQRGVSPFVKNEVYQGVKPPRNITQYNGNDKLDYSAYMYAVSERLKEMPWYAFGKTPAEIAVAVAKICEKAKEFIDPSDASKMDGHVSPAARTAERMFLLYAFPERYHAEIIDLHDAQFNNVGTADGVKYDQGTSRGSGSPETSSFNTFLMALISYYAFRLSGKTADEAWSALGLYGGDDAHNADIPQASLAKAARAFGQEIKSRRVERGAKDVEFLARRYSPYVWNGAPDSCCNISRQLSKFHLTVNTAVDPAEKLKQKCMSYYLTDRNTPIIGAYCKRVLEMMQITEDEIADYDLDPSYSSYFAKFKFDVQFPNDNVDNWMYDYLHEQYPDLHVGESELIISRLTNIKEALNMPLFVERKPPTDIPSPVDINGERYFPLKNGEAVPIPVGAVKFDLRKPKEPRPKFDVKGFRKLATPKATTVVPGADNAVKPRVLRPARRTPQLPGKPKTPTMPTKPTPSVRGQK